MNKKMKNILDFTREDLALWFEGEGIRPFRSSQIFKWIYIRQADNFEQMTDLSKALRKKLADHFIINRLAMEEKQVSIDTTEKFLFQLMDGNYIESVLIPEKDHFTLCVSSQVGCSLACKFCATGYMDRIRNLDPGEIYDQVVHITGQAQGSYDTPLTNK